MKNRGPILLIFSMSLVLSPMVIRSIQIAQQGGQTEVSTGISTAGARRDDCEARTFRASTYSFGCRTGHSGGGGHNQMAGGAMFVSSR